MLYSVASTRACCARAPPPALRNTCCRKCSDAFKREHPRVKLQISSGNTEEVVGPVAGRTKLQSVSSKARRGGKMCALSLLWKTNWYCSIPRIIYGKVESLLTVDDLKGVPFLLRERGSGTRRVLEIALEKAGLKKNDMEVAMELDSTEAIISSVECRPGNWVRDPSGNSCRGCRWGRSRLRKSKDCEFRATFRWYTPQARNRRDSLEHFENLLWNMRRRLEHRRLELNSLWPIAISYH